MIEQFKTIFKSTQPIEIKEKNSRFISQCFPIPTKEEAEETVKKLWKIHYDCTHICFAYLLGEGEITAFRYSDDGEPSGTAGLPIYNEILRKELFNVLVTSVRYYGGIKLGTGGLTRTYGASARAALDSCEVETVIIKKELSVEIPFDFTGIAMSYIGRFEGLEIKSTTYNEKGSSVNVRIPIASVEKFIAEMIEKTGGKIKPEIVN
ncbi:YigZ family protein [bacterium]|nr:YigZ family protein [bacterium]